MVLNKKISLFCSLIILIILITQNSFSGVPKEAVKNTIIESKIEPKVDSLQLLQDSLFAIINKSFQKVKPMLENSCYNCHSDKTNEPWYYNLPVVNSFVSTHVKAGREHLDFSDGFPFKTEESQLHILHKIKEEVEEGEMPIFSYRIMHWGKLIENEKQDSLFEWIDKTEIMLNEFYKKHDMTQNSDK